MLQPLTPEYQAYHDQLKAWVAQLPEEHLIVLRRIHEEASKWPVNPADAKTYEIAAGLILERILTLPKDAEESV
jgi:hypothetical protein